MVFEKPRGSCGVTVMPTTLFVAYVIGISLDWSLAEQPTDLYDLFRVASLAPQATGLDA